MQGMPVWNSMGDSESDNLALWQCAVCYNHTSVFIPAQHNHVYFIACYILTDTSSKADRTARFRITGASFSVMLFLTNTTTSIDAKRHGGISQISNMGCLQLINSLSIYLTGTTCTA